MPTNFPTSVDNFTNPTANDSLNIPSHSLQHANANDAIEAIEAAIISPVTYPNQLVNATTATVRPLPFAMASGQVNINNFAAITLPAGRFTQVPRTVLTSVEPGTLAAPAIFEVVSGTTSAINVHCTTAAHGANIADVIFIAIQMTSANASG